MSWQRQEIIIEARRWIGTPYRHQHRTRGLGVDCIGLIWGVGEAAGVLTVDMAKARRFMAYTRSPNPKRMGEALATFFEKVEAEYQPGDFAWMGWDRKRVLPQHLAILGEAGDRPTIIHADSRVGRCVEHGFAGGWPGQVVSWWRYPGVL